MKIKFATVLRLNLFEISGAATPERTPQCSLQEHRLNLFEISGAATSRILVLTAAGIIRLNLFEISGAATPSSLEAYKARGFCCTCERGRKKY